MDEARRLAIQTSYGVQQPESRRGPLPPDTLPRADLRRLSASVALVTGAGHGIGRDIARTLAAAGAKVVVADVDEAAAEEVAAEIEKQRGACEAFRTDVSSEPRVRQLAEHICERYGRLDIVVNNAGIIHVDRLLEIPVDTWRRVLRVNADGTFLVTQAAVRVMRCQPRHPELGRRGILVNMSSIAAEVARPTHAAYGASKAAINHLSKTCAAAFVTDEIATIVVYPGNVREGMWRHLGASIAEVENRSREEIEAERSFQPSLEVAEIVRDAVAAPGLVLNGSLVLGTRDIVEI